jgi:hypothetical protein
MVFNVIFNNIPFISWRSVLLVEEPESHGENHRPAVSHWQTLTHNAVSSTPCRMGFELTTLVVIGTEYIDSCKSNYHSSYPNIFSGYPINSAHIKKVLSFIMKVFINNFSCLEEQPNYGQKYTEYFRFVIYLLFNSIGKPPVILLIPFYCSSVIRYVILFLHRKWLCNLV